jgi:hypothetical protein
MIPGLKIAASRLAAETLKKENAIKLIRKLNAYYEENYKYLAKGEDVLFQPVDVDRIIEDGETMDMNGYIVRAIATPGHTRDSITYYIHFRGGDWGYGPETFSPSAILVQLQGIYQLARKIGIARSRSHLNGT